MTEQTKITIAQSLMICVVVLAFIFGLIAPPVKAKDISSPVNPIEAPANIFYIKSLDQTNSIYPLSLEGAADLIGSGVR